MDIAKNYFMIHIWGFLLLFWGFHGCCRVFFFFLFFMHDQFNDDYMQNAVDVKGRFWNFSKAKKEREDLILMRRTRESEFFWEHSTERPQVNLFNTGL